MKRTVYRLLDLALAVALSLAIASAGHVRAAAWTPIRENLRSLDFGRTSMPDFAPIEFNMRPFGLTL